MENEDLLGGEAAELPEPVEPVVAEPAAPAEPADISPEVNTEGAKSVADAIDFGLKEVEDRRKPKEPVVPETDEEKAAREATEAARPRNPDGTFKTAEQIAAEPPKVEPKDEAAKLAAAINDPIPPQVAEKTRERMQTLINTVKDKDGQIAQHQAFVDQIAATGATPPEFQTMMSYLTAVHSDNRDHLVLAKNLLLSELEGISLKLGEAAPGVDFLAKYPDLQAQVQRGEIRREAAQELAINRTRAANQDAERKAAATRTQTETAAKNERETAQADLTTLGNDLFKRDGAEYQRRYQILEPALEALGMLPPTQWKAAFLRAYNAIPALPKPVTLPNGGVKPVAGAAPVVPKGQPLRPNKTPSGESNAGPKSLFEAIDGALKGM